MNQARSQFTQHTPKQVSGPAISFSQCQQLMLKRFLADDEWRVKEGWGGGGNYRKVIHYLLRSPMSEFYACASQFSKINTGCGTKPACMRAMRACIHVKV